MAHRQLVSGAVRQVRSRLSLSLAMWLALAALAASGGGRAVAQVPGGLNVSLSASPNPAMVGQTVTFSYRASPPAVAPPFASLGNIIIDFGDGTTVNLAAAYPPGQSANATTDHVYTSPGTYTATLTVDASNGGKGQTSTQVTVTAITGPLVGQGVPVNLKAGWNLVALPPNTRGLSGSETLYTFQAGDTAYETVQTPKQGLGYWVFLSAPATITISSGSPQTATVNAPAGQFVMVGNPGSFPAKITGADLVYTYDPANGYQTATTLQPGQGAWVLSNRGGTVTISN